MEPTSNTIAVIRMKSQLIQAGFCVRSLDVDKEEDKQAIEKIWNMWKEWEKK